MAKLLRTLTNGNDNQQFVLSFAQSLAGFDGYEIYGLEGNDTITGSSGHDIIDGGAGQDVLRGGNGNDELTGGDDYDELFGEAGADTLYGAMGNDMLDGGTGDDFLSGGYGDDQLFGAAGNDLLHGNAGNDYLSGHTGEDELFGDSGNDILTAGSGIDRLIGGRGADQLTGGADSDFFVFTQAVAGEIDRITDFDRAGADRDFIDISALLDSVGFAGATFQQAKDAGFLRFVADGATGSRIVIDTNGNAADVSPDIVIAIVDNVTVSQLDSALNFIV
jgi:Ca2+-binding RTX toxin-like protein